MKPAQKRVYFFVRALYQCLQFFDERVDFPLLITLGIFVDAFDFKEDFLEQRSQFLG